MQTVKPTCPKAAVLPGIHIMSCSLNSLEEGIV